MTFTKCRLHLLANPTTHCKSRKFFLVHPIHSSLTGKYFATLFTTVFNITVGLKVIIEGSPIFDWYSTTRTHMNIISSCMRIKLLLRVCALLPRFQTLIENPNALMLPMRQKYMDEKMHHVECACRDPLKGAVYIRHVSKYLQEVEKINYFLHLS